MNDQQESALQSLFNFTARRFDQLMRYEDGRTPLYLTEEQYNAIRDLVAQASAAPEQGPVCWVPYPAQEKLRNGRNNSPAVLTDGPAEFNDTPLFTHADPSEVERLRAENKKYVTPGKLAASSGFAARLEQVSDELEAATQRADAAERKLTERDALLRNIESHYTSGMSIYGECEEIRALLSASAEPASPWTCTNEELPENEKQVLVSFPSKQRVGFYVRAYSINTESRAFDGDSDYHEESDSSYWPAGWYFFEDGMDMWMASSENPTHWMPLPDAPAKGGDGEVQL